MSRLGWAAQSTFRVDDLYFGVRANTSEADAVVRRALARHWVPEVEAPPNFSVSLHPALDGHSGVRPLDLLYRSGTLVARGRRPIEIVHALASYLSGFGGDLSDVLVTSAAALHRDGVAVLVPRELYSVLDTLDPHLRRRRLRFVHAPFSLLDRRTGTLVVRPPAVDVAPELGPRPGHYSIRGWAFFAGTPTLPWTLGVAMALRTVDRRAAGAQATLDTLGRLFSSAAVVGFSAADRELITRLDEVMSG